MSPDASTTASARPDERPRGNRLTARIRRHEGATRVSFRGELDPATCEHALEILWAAADLDGDLLVDLAEVPFFDSHAVRALLAVRRHLARRDARLVVCNPTPPVRRVLSVLDQCVEGLPPFDLRVD